MKHLLVVLMLAPLLSFSQEKVTILKDTILEFPTKSWPHSPVLVRNVVLSNGAMLHVGSKIKLGKGTLPNGDFNYIATASNTMEAKLRGSTQLTSLVIEKIIKKGNEKYGVKFVIICEGKYIVQLENGIATGEVVAPVPKSDKPVATSEVPAG